MKELIFCSSPFWCRNSCSSLAHTPLSPSSSCARLLCVCVCVFVCSSLPMCSSLPVCLRVHGARAPRLLGVGGSVLGRAHAPLLIIKTYEHSCVCLVPSLYVRPSCTMERFGCAHAPLLVHKDVRAFVIVFSSPSLYVFPSCDEGAFRSAHAPLLLIKVYGHLCVCAFCLCCTFGHLVMRERSSVPMHLSSS